ncbi:MAG: hypothetical protein C4523_05675 [Myxococcales bacterium]|nr:MAG: hypothetical protein C4523_05675 [Myxococcales bacterium]
MPWTRLIAVLAVLLPAAAQASPIFPAGAYPALDEAVRHHERQFYELNARPFGLSLDAHVKDEAARATVESFLVQDESDDFVAATGVHPYTLLQSYGENGDLGFFGGVALVGTAYEYMTLKRDGGPEAALAAARARVVRAAQSWHIFYVVTSGNGVVARGIHRLTSENESDPPLPPSGYDPVPLFDEEGKPLPQPKNNGVDREDNSGGVLPPGVWGWIDSASKDQLVGQIFGLTALYDAMKDDPDVDQALVAQLVEDARGVAEMLMTKRDISGLEGAFGSGEYDLIIMDADGRPTFYHDLNPYSLEKIYFPLSSSQYNVFNAIMAIGVMKGLFHLTGDPDIEAFLYEDLLYERDFLGKLTAFDGPDAIDYTYLGLNTNFDVPDMTAVALFLALYLEDDPEVTEPLRDFMERGWWRRDGESHTAALCKQPVWNSIYMAITDRGAPQDLIDSTAALLEGFPLGAYWNDRRENCDADELAAMRCTAIDGETILTLDKVGEDGAWASGALDPRIRPPSNFDARSNPFEVNGGGGLRLNPGGDHLAAYWLGRYMEANAEGETNVSPHVRAHMPLGGEPAEDGDAEPDGDGEPDGDAADGDQVDGDAADGDAPDGDDAEDEGGGCAASTGAAGWCLLIALASLARVNRRRRSARPSVPRS